MAMKKVRILVAEDENLVGKDIQQMLKALGYEVVAVVSSGEEVVESAGRALPDLVLMDIILKGEMDGIAAARKIWEKMSIPVIYLTAYADEKTLQRAKVTEPFGYILKPFDEREMQKTIEMALYKAKMEKRLRDHEEWLSTLLGSIGDGVIATGADDLISFMNPQAEKITGWREEDALRQPLTTVLPLEEETRISFHEDDRKGHSQESRLRTKHGSIIPIEGSLSRIGGGHKEIIGNVFVFRDISGRKEVEAQLRQSWERLRKALAGTVQAMSVAIEMRDPYTAGHQRRVAKLSGAIAQAMGLPPDRVEAVRMAGGIHDIGKIYVPAEILSKPVQITDIEFSIIKTHAQVGYDILKSIEFPWPLALIVYQHHERLDGSGYPNRLKGQAILLEARIIGVADVVEAMSSTRPYRPPHGFDKALAEIEKNRSVLYDPAVVDACERVVKEKGFTFED
jgi:PAS domain S-box-containing protein/putative nucleotidyltransferase with HDIG domain